MLRSSYSPLTEVDSG